MTRQNDRIGRLTDRAVLPQYSYPRLTFPAEEDGQEAQAEDQLGKGQEEVRRQHA
jgi:hypothetical protein